MITPLFLTAVTTAAPFAQASEPGFNPESDGTCAGWYGTETSGSRLDLRDGYISKPSLDIPYLEQAFDSDHVTLPFELLPQEGRFQPMIQEGETGFVPSEHFTRMAKTLAIMNKLAYSRGQDYRFGHELMYQDTLAGWTLKNISGKRGLVFNDPNTGFVAYSKALRTVAIVLHGSINTADWITNFDARKVRIDAQGAITRTAQDGTGMLVQKMRLPFPGFAHKGFLDKYDSFQEQVMTAVDDLLSPERMTPEEKQDLKFYVSGHSQGAALSQFLTLHLCHHLRKHYGPDFVNARANRVHAWLLASPTGMDATAVAHAEGMVGAANIVVQNTWLDVVPNVGYSTDFVHFKALGTPVMQSSLTAAQRSLKAHRTAVATHIMNGDVKEAGRGILPGNYMNAAIATNHMATDNVNYRGVGHSFAFDPEMVDQSLKDLKEGLQMAFDQKQDRLRAKATSEQRAGSASSTWDRFKAFFN